jgi:hypothetical protein
MPNNTCNVWDDTFSLPINIWYANYWQLNQQKLNYYSKNDRQVDQSYWPFENPKVLQNISVLSISQYGVLETGGCLTTWDEEI